jgi:hypothetical protein
VEFLMSAEVESPYSVRVKNVSVRRSQASGPRRRPAVAKRPRGQWSP